MDAKLKECPFCGGKARHLAGHIGFYSERVICDACDFYLSPAVWNNRPDAIAPPVAAGSVDTGELRRLAFDATRGPWRHTRQGVVVAGPFRQYTNGSAQSQIASFCVTSHEEDDEHQTEKQVPNALFSAAACPDVVLALIERAEKAEATIRRLEYYLRQMGMDIPEPFGQPIDPSDTPTV